MALIKIDIFLYLAFNGQIIMKQILAPPDSGHTWNKTLKCEAAITIIGMINLPLGAFFIRKERLSGSNIVLVSTLSEYLDVQWSLTCEPTVHSLYPARLVDIYHRKPGV